MQLFFTKTGFQILHPQNQRSARAGLNLKSLLRNNNIWCVFINVNLKSFESMNKQFKRLPGVRLSTSVLIRWDGWLSTNSNIGRPLQLETFSREKQKWKVNQKHKHKQRPQKIVIFALSTLRICAHQSSKSSSVWQKKPWWTKFGKHDTVIQRKLLFTVWHLTTTVFTYLIPKFSKLSEHMCFTLLISGNCEENGMIIQE